jgi:type II secretory pathway pseudopilin PulG
MLRADRRDRSGVVLLEALVALLILTTAGAAAVTLVAEGAREIQRVRSAEKQMHDASAFFDAVSLWSRDDLDRHLGNRNQGDWLMRVDRPDLELYVVSLTDTATKVELLRTSVYRPEVAHAEP